MNGFIQFMNTTLGRLVRIGLGIVLIYVGLVTFGGTLAGYIIAVVGLLPIAMGVWGRCLVEFVFPQKKHA